jgi:uridine phosphorylase
MIDLNKEAEENAKKHFGITICSDGFYRTYEDGFKAGATKSKYVQAENLKAQIDLLEEVTEKLSIVDIYARLHVLQQQLNQLENES